MQYLRTTKIIKNGNSLAVVVPKEILKAGGFERGDQIFFYFNHVGAICMKKLSDQDIRALKYEESQQHN